MATAAVPIASAAQLRDCREARRDTLRDTLSLVFGTKCRKIWNRVKSLPDWLPLRKMRSDKGLSTLSP